MDVEFHYYQTYLIAIKAGFEPKEAKIIAYSAQYLDDNDISFKIEKDSQYFYENYISQTSNIFKSKETWLKLNPVFHFIPGDPLCISASRRDGRMHHLNCTPDSPNANEIMDSALESENLYRIGIAAHGYADTWAHQNFIGFFEDFNSVNGFIPSVMPNLGHADFLNRPDYACATWVDERLLEPKIDNSQRFLQAASHLFYKLAQYKNPQYSASLLKEKELKLIGDLSVVMSKNDEDNRDQDKRIEAYMVLGVKETYDKYVWFEEAISEDVRFFKDRNSVNHFLDFNIFPDVLSWKNRQTYKTSHWYLFQEAIKAQQKSAWEILERNTFHKLDMELLKLAQIF